MNLKFWSVRWTGVSHDRANVTARLSEIKSGITSMGAGWFVSSSGEWPPEVDPTPPYSSDTGWLILQHTSGAELIFICSYFGDVNCHNDNQYGGGAATNPDTLRIAFKPSHSPTASVLINSGGYDPLNVSTWCADQGVYRFHRFDHNSGDLDLTASGRLHLVCDVDSGMFVIMSWVSNAIRNMHWYLDDTTPGFASLSTPGDAERSFVLYDFDFGPGSYHPDLTYRSLDGTVVEQTGNDVEVDARLGSMDDNHTLLGVDPEPLVEIEVAHNAYPVPGVKGLVNPEVVCFMRDDVPTRYRMRHPGRNAHYIRINAGSSDKRVVTVWPADQPFAM